MNYRRVLYLTELGRDIQGAVALIRRVAPDADLLDVIALLPERQFTWFARGAPDAAAGFTGRR